MIITKCNWGGLTGCVLFFKRIRTDLKRIRTDLKRIRTDSKRIHTDSKMKREVLDCSLKCWNLAVVVEQVVC